jgi:uncharacterized protein
MLSLAEPYEFDWDAANAVKNEIKHGVKAYESEQVFSNKPFYLLEDSKHSHVKERWHAYGQTNEARLLHISFTMREPHKIRVISARDMHRNERKWYEAQEA